MGLDRIRIVLVEPAGARNVGSIARIMTNMGLSQLVLVAPRCDWLGEEAMHMAVHARSRLEEAQVVPDLRTALVGCERVVATTHRQDLPMAPTQSPATALGWLRAATGPAAILFGREDRGLDNQELDFAQRYLRIPVDSAYTSLNLAQAVGICAYELVRTEHETDSVKPTLRERTQNSTDLVEPATIDQIDRYLGQLETLLLDVGYLYPHTAPSRIAKLRRIYNRSSLSEEELALLWGMCKQLRWALEQGRQ
jgi:tRNA/rRNA methyltransferase